MHFDLLDAGAVATVVKRLRPDVVLHTVGLTSVDGCEDNPDLARLLHEDATRHMLAAAERVGAGFIHVRRPQDMSLTTTRLSS